MSTVPNDDSALVGGAEKYEQRARDFGRGIWHDETVKALAALLDEVAREARAEGMAEMRDALERAHKRALPLTGESAEPDYRALCEQEGAALAELEDVQGFAYIGHRGTRHDKKYRECSICNALAALRAAGIGTGGGA